MHVCLVYFAVSSGVLVLETKKKDKNNLCVPLIGVLCLSLYGIYRILGDEKIEGVRQDIVYMHNWKCS